MANPTVQPVASEQREPFSKRSKKKSSISSQVLICIADCKYDVVREAARAKGWKLVNEDPEASTARKCHVYWIDVPAIVERMQHLQRWQRINHFPGMSNVARKGRMAQNLDRMRRTFPNEYSFYPRTWVLPVEWGSFKAEFDASGRTTRTFIIKPDSGCQGRGIFLTQDLERVDAMESQVAQLYIQKPLLIEGFKFDLRLYVLVTSVIPLRVYAFKDGLTRFCTEEYTRPSSHNLGRRCMHLTNYAVNKGSENFVANDEANLGSKRSLRWLMGWIASERGGPAKADALWRKMGGAIIKTLVSVLPTLHREYLHTFGHDNSVHCPAAASATITKNTKSKNPGGSDLNSSSGARPPLGRVGAENIASTGGVGSTCWNTRATVRRGGDFGQVDDSDEKPSRPRWGDGCDVGNVQQPTCEPVSFPSSEAEGSNKTLDKVEITPPRSSLNPLASSCTMKERGGKGDTRPGLVEAGGGGGVGGEGLPSYDSPDFPADGSSKNAAGTNSSTPRAGGNGGGSAASGDRERVVEGSRCVEILGFDFMIDAALKPWLIEVNHLPSFATDSPLDRRIKAQVVSAALSVLHAKADDKKSYEDNAKRDAQNRLYNPDISAAGLAQREKERKETEEVVAKIRRKLEAIYMRFAPHKVGKVGGLLARYAGDEDRLLRIVRRKYVLDPGRANAGGDGAAAAEGKKPFPTSASVRGDGVDGQPADHQPSMSSSTLSSTAPVHGSSIATLGYTTGDEHRSQHVLDKIRANPIEGKISTPGKHLGGHGKLKHGEGHAKTWLADARIPDPPRDVGLDMLGKRGGTFNEEGSTASRSAAPVAVSTSPSWVTEHDFESLGRETEVLEGWERLHPPPKAAATVKASAKATAAATLVSPVKPSPSATAHNNDDDDDNDNDNDISSKNINDDNAAQEESENGGDGVDVVGGIGKASSGGGKGSAAKGERRRRKPAAAVEVMIQRAFEDDRKLTLRLKCPLQQQRGGGMDPETQPATKLPQIGVQFALTAASATATATTAQQSNLSSPPAVLCPEQREKAQRLMQGYSSSSRRSLSAPSRTTPSTTTPPEEERSWLPVSLRIAVVRAKEWRRRRDESNGRRNTRSVAIKMHTFDFGGVKTIEDGGHKS